MKIQLVILAIAVIGSTRSAPQHEAAIDGQGEEIAVGVAEIKGTDDSSADYQNDHHTEYHGTKDMSNVYMALYYASWTRERDALMVAQSYELQQKAGKPVKEDESKEEKEEVAPMCAMKADAGPSRSNVQRYYYNEDRQRCEMFIYGGCYGNPNNFRTKYECENSCMNRCSKPINVGYCSARLPRYYYNTATEQGPCVSGTARWYHNSVTGQCEMFIYSGCGGNANNYP
ncbi:tissue factor pathway inhibitor-like [Watersipora subatra]|uniref:tissue factor pathway inhibitor-like n=1 Tax=Watersipora subatra TaxID=2589382 RepID=UPI00355B715A